jgi:drug/metabolite transporter (DMT)-like permease
VLLALFVTFLWSTSWVLIKIGLEEISPLFFAGVRYAGAAVVLLTLLLHQRHRASLVKLRAADWCKLVVLGLAFYTLTQGAAFVGLKYLRPATLSLFLSFTPILVALSAVPLLHERPTLLQWGGLGLYLLGAGLYLLPQGIGIGPAVGLTAACVGLLANTGASILGRHINREQRLSPVVVTAVSMAIGSGVLLGAGVAAEGMQTLSLTSWAIVAWLALVNTAFAFTLWNITLRTLPAMESSIINNTMMVQIAILAWVFLGDALSWIEIVGILLAAAGATAVQIFRGHRAGGHRRSVC